MREKMKDCLMSTKNLARTVIEGRRQPGLPQPEHVLLAWLGGRRVAVHLAQRYWLVLTPHGALRQGRRMSLVDEVRWRALPAWFRERHQGTSHTAGDEQ
jgi:hypothetical protein